MPIDLERLIEVRKLLQEQRSRWFWELEQAENTRAKGDEQHFLRAKAGYRCTQEALDAVEGILGDATGWPDLFPQPSPPGAEATQ